MTAATVAARPLPRPHGRQAEADARMAGFRIGVTTFGADGGRSGIGRYTRAQLNEFAALRTNHVFESIGARGEQAAFSIPGIPYLPVTDTWSPPLRNLVWHQSALPSVCRRRAYDVLFIPAGNRRLPIRSVCPTVATVHDLSQLHVNGKYDPARQIYARRVLPALMRRVSRVITVSESSKRDIVEFAGVQEERVTVIPNGVDLDRFRSMEPEVARNMVGPTLGLDRPFFLYVARLEHPGKNHVRLIEAFDRFKSETRAPHELVLAGPDWTRADAIRQAANAARHAKAIRFIGFVPGEHLPMLYAASTGLVFPSLFEGFGIPLLEAMASGVPVASARCSSLPEVAGDAALYFDPMEPEDIAAAMKRLVEDPLLCRTLVSRGLRRVCGFTWQISASRTLEVLEKAAKED